MLSLSFFVLFAQATLPVCDMYPTLDLAEAPASAVALAANGGYALGQYPNYYNSGFIYLRG